MKFNRNLVIAILWLISATLFTASALVNDVKVFFIFSALFALLISLLHFVRYFNERRQSS
ncbi:hypothetical protein EZV73_27710 [Acidaminobacter sp. JC074]|uniref:hypothetical protein n=1 Tax=Acidaminobacter sp. JC074 TaxID=2530199 RepID=UPI001F1092D5|nr:hypothetical protein [Acidaminobacter sp. JC074]MCH4891389.1 hypothetical protein [Acidaminobacter sp. JC074]